MGQGGGGGGGGGAGGNASPECGSRMGATEGTGCEMYPDRHTKAPLMRANDVP